MDISNFANVHKTVKIWPGTIVRENAIIGEGTTVGRDVYIGPGVKIGTNCKIQNKAQIYEPAEIGNGVFVGPGVIITNDKVPRSISIDFSLKKEQDWQKSVIVIENGASLGAGSIYVGSITIGEWSMVGAGSVVVKDVNKFELIAGNPGRRIGWVGKSGFRLTYKAKGIWTCPITLEEYYIDELK